jgi:hypothetical protein
VGLKLTDYHISEDGALGYIERNPNMRNYEPIFVFDIADDYRLFASTDSKYNALGATQPRAGAIAFRYPLARDSR